MMQEDIKKLIAYSSVAHMGFVTMGLFTLNAQGVQGAVFQMVSHGLVSGALFLCVGVVYDRMHTREIAAYGGLVNRMPLYALAAFVLFKPWWLAFAVVMSIPASGLLAWNWWRRSGRWRR
jgi:NADH-quinone oxidoreductase subunit M